MYFVKSVDSLGLETSSDTNSFIVTDIGEGNSFLDFHIVRIAKVNGRVEIELTVPFNSKINVRLYNVTGRIVQGEVFSLESGRQRIELGSRFRPGVYFLEVDNRHKILRKRFVIF